jgi:hypothetical protein
LLTRSKPNEIITFIGPFPRGQAQFHFMPDEFHLMPDKFHLMPEPTICGFRHKVKSAHYWNQQLTRTIPALNEIFVQHKVKFSYSFPA